MGRIANAAARRRRCRTPKLCTTAAVLLSLTAAARPAAAWVFHEHAIMTVHGIRGLAPDERQLLAGLWDAARRDAGAQLCPRPDVFTFDARGRPSCVPYAALAAIAGDHSCTPAEMWRVASEARWMLKVLAIANELRLAGKGESVRFRLADWSLSDLRLQLADPDYATRATTNYSHFVLWREQQLHLGRYLDRVLRPASQMNAAAQYAYQHLAALRFAWQAGRLPSADARRAELIRAALRAEAFAVHFIEDAFSAGHVAGNWGSTSIRKGTHDHYSTNGVPAITWDGEPYSAYGDASMTQGDLDRGKVAVTEVLRQFLQAFADTGEPAAVARSLSSEQAQRFGEVDACKTTKVPYDLPGGAPRALLRQAWRRTIRPFTGPDEAHLPRFRAEVGLFVGFVGGVRVGAAFDGFDSPAPASPRASGTLDALFTFGLGLEGVTGLRSDGTVAVGAGIAAAGEQFDGVCGSCEHARFIGESLPRVPGRLGIAFRMRIPFFLVPFDLLLAAPVLSWAAPKRLAQMAVIAADGGLLPWQIVLFSRIGDFQFVLGRDAQVTLYGLAGGSVFVRRDPVTGSPVPLNFKSVEIAVPILEYRPFRSFSEKLTATLALQLGLAADLTYGVEELKGAPATGLGNIYLVYLRLLFDARIYPFKNR